MSLTVRRGGMGDLPCACAIDAAALDSDRREWLVRAFAGEAGRQTWIAERDGQALAFAVVGRFFAYPFLELIVTAAAARRTGAAAGLMAAVEAAHRDTRLFVSTNQSNAAMRALLEARGYQPAGELDHLDPGDPERFYVRLPAS